MARRKSFRSPLTTGKKLLDNADGRSRWARRYRDLCILYIGEHGGRDKLSQSELALIMNIATIQTELERRAADIADTDGASDSQFIGYLQGSNSLQRMLDKLGSKHDPEDARLSNTNTGKGNGKVTAHRIMLPRVSRDVEEVEA